MNKLFLNGFVIVVMTMAMVFTSCKTSKDVSYSANQATPTTKPQEQAANRGLKIAKEECEEKALEQVNTLRESGNGISDKEAFATNLALLDARAKLAQQLEVLVNGLIRNFNQQHEADGDFTSVAKAGQLQQAYFEQFLTNTSPICKNTYVKDDGKYNVYVCVELGNDDKKTMYKKLSDDKKLQVDFQEHQFLQELDKAKEDYRKKQSEK